MTGGVVVVIGPTGNNFGAGMSGGIAYVYDPSELFDTRCNFDMVDLESVTDPEDRDQLRGLIEKHFEWTEKPEGPDASGQLGGAPPAVRQGDPHRLPQGAGTHEDEGGHGNGNRGRDRGGVQWVSRPDFWNTRREDPSKRKVADRIRDFREFELLLPADRLQRQASRCMDCGVPYCHAFGCPLRNRIPDFNHMVYLGQWQRALDLLHETNNFPEFTGRLCPAPCEAACTLAINQIAGDHTAHRAADRRMGLARGRDQAGTRGASGPTGRSP